MTRRRIAAVLLALCGVLLLLTWHFGEVWFWIWQGAGEHFYERFSLYRMSGLDLDLKIAGVAFLAAALLAWPPRRSN